MFSRKGKKTGKEETKNSAKKISEAPEETSLKTGSDGTPTPASINKSSDLKLDTRPATEKDLPAVHGLFEAEGWKLTLGDLQDWKELYPQCIWAGFLENKLVACCMAVPMDDGHGYMSNLIIKEGHRRQGLGRLMFERVSNSRTFSFKQQNVFLAAPNDTETMLERWGFTFSRHQVYCCEGIPKLPVNFTPPTWVKIQPITFDNLHSVLELDEEVTSSKREHIWRHFIRSKNTIVAKCAFDKEEIQGFIMLRKDVDEGARISAFYAESHDVARALLHNVVQNDVREGKNLIGWFSIVNIDRCRKLYREFGLDDPEYWARGMFTKDDSKVPWFKVYSIFEYYTWLV